jgi:putative membrane protein
MNIKNVVTLSVLLIFSICTIVLAAGNFPTDDQIAKIVTTTNDGEIAMAKLAEGKATNSDVKNFAKHMIKDHEKNNSKTAKLAKKLKLTPTENDKSKEMKSEASSRLENLQNLNGKEFDMAYISAQISAHQKVLNDLDSVLIPGARNERLKKQLEKTRSTVAKHLEHAKQIQTEL